MDTKERDRQLSAAWLEEMQKPFNGFIRPENRRSDDGPARTAKAAEYAAFQLYEINQKLAQIIELLKKP